MPLSRTSSRGVASGARGNEQRGCEGALPLGGRSSTVATLGRMAAGFEGRHRDAASEFFEEAVRV
jgi:hypothetical protein